MSDFQCPYCRQFALTVFPTLEREFVHTGKVRFVYVNFPLTAIHRHAVAAAAVAMCAARQNRFWPVHDLLFQRQERSAPQADPGPTLLAPADSGRPDPKRPLVWVHAPSVGEGLQAKPVLEALRAERPQWQLAYTFFSPSAERLARTLPADVTDYLPFDRPGDVGAVLAALEPSALVFAKLDVWPELTLAAARRGVKLGLIAATVAPHSSRLRWPARQWAEAAYRALDRVGTISEEDGRRLRALGARSEAIQVTGDTRYDSVVERAERFDRTREPFLRLGAVRADAFTIVAGSTWPGDEAVVLPAFADLLAQVPTARPILAPRHPQPAHPAGIALVAPRLNLPPPGPLSQLDHAAPPPVIRR